MAASISSEVKQHAHQLLDLLPPDQFTAVVHLLETMVPDDHDDEELTEEDRKAIIASREYFEQGNEGLSLEDVARECGFTMEEVLAHRSKRT